VSTSKLTTYTEMARVLAALPMLVREARRARGLSIRAAAVQIGCSFSTVTRFERGEDCTLSNAALMLAWLDDRRPIS
jgi:ribosome-binding protein aMBF1 (putative translation factor)